jgi:hypothetical protein
MNTTYTTQFLWSRVTVTIVIISFQYSSTACFILDLTSLEPILYSLVKNDGVHECIHNTTIDVYLQDDFTHIRSDSF